MAYPTNEQEWVTRVKREGISMKKDDFTEEELKTIYGDFLENDIEPASDSVREAYEAMRNAFEEYLCAVEEDMFINGFLCGRRNRVPGIKEGGITYPRDEQEFVHQWLDTLDDPGEADEIQGMATVEAINRAYYAGLEEGRRERAENAEKW